VDQALKKYWDPSKSAQANLSNLGFIGKPKGLHDVDDNAAGGIVPTKTNIIEVFDIPKDNSTTTTTLSRRQKHPLTVDEEAYVINGMKKYNDDFIKFFRDTKVNYLQHTEEKINKLCSRFISLQNEQRHTPIEELPSNIQSIISS
jgi:Ribosome biogenesis protein Nop16